MARPLRKPHTLKIRVSAAELEALTRLAGDRPLGPSIIERALVADGSTPRRALEAWERRWLLEVRRTAGNFGAVRAALDALARELG